MVWVSLLMSVSLLGLVGMKRLLLQLWLQEDQWSLELAAASQVAPSKDQSIIKVAEKGETKPYVDNLILQLGLVSHEQANYFH